MSIRALPAALAGLAAATALPAAEPEPAAAGGPGPIETVTIIGRPDQVERAPGSAHYLGRVELERFLYSDVLRVLRAVPGVYLQDEEGYGLRPNIGLRGSGLDRSARITLLEDGVLIAPAPYAASSAYYFPTQRRMSGVEVLKGPSSISQGPRTTGGAVNLLSRAIPDAPGGAVDALFGADEFVDTDAWYGASSEHFGFLVETVQQNTEGFKEIDGNGNKDSGYDLQDYLLKLRVNSGAGARWYQSLEVKLGLTEQDSNASYLGLTDADFAADPFRRYAASQLDNIDTRHEQYQVSWLLAPASARWSLDVTAYRNNFERNWYKLETVGGAGISDILADPQDFATELDWIRGADSPADSLAVRNNNRSYYSRGLQARWTSGWTAGPADFELTLGARYHEDEEDRFQDSDLYQMLDQQLVLTTDGTPGSQTNRVSDAEAQALFARADIAIGRWRLSPGLRYEDITLRRLDYSTADPDRSAGPTQVSRHDLSVLIPGLGVTYAFGPRWSALAGVHRGFNPPGPGSNSEEEDSTNYELGLRYRNGELRAEAIGFYNDYSNLVGTVTASTGGGGEIGDQFDAGEVKVSGLELTGGYRFSELGERGWSVPVSLAYTWTTEAEFQNSFESDFEPWGDVITGDDLPYVPRHQLQLSTGLEASSWGVLLKTTYVDETRTVAGQGPIPDDEATDSYFIVDLAARYQFTPRLRGFLRVDNLLDDTYIVARRPAGVRPGRDRLALIGARFDF